MASTSAGISALDDEEEQSVDEEEQSVDEEEQSMDEGAPEERQYSHPVYKQLSLLNGKINKYSKEDLVKQLKSLRLDSEGSKNVLTKRLKNFYKKTMLSVYGTQEKNGNSRVRVMFDYYVVIDFEATCQTQRNPSFKQEIIEFPAVLLNCQKCEVEDEFRSYCQPVINPILTDFCTELTGISQADVDSAPRFPEVLNLFDEWLQKKKLGTKYSFAIVTDGPWDMGYFLKRQCLLSKVEYPTCGQYWINIRKTFANFYDTTKMPLGTMINLIGREFQGRAHSGLDDARNIACIVQRLLKDGAKVVFNEKLAEGNPRHRADGTPIFAVPVYTAEMKSIHGNLRPNYPPRKTAKI